MKEKLIEDGEETKVNWIAQACFAGVALIGLLAKNREVGQSIENHISEAWKAGDLMASEFINRGNAIDAAAEKGEQNK